ncbi:hypothetical protein DFH29DRAFT_948719 [Suillus ampliporus]|nr:hypothetical protein DFH29DRAFT_948719 [Suillus ampliporus]
MYSCHANELVINLLDVISDLRKHSVPSLITAVTYGHTSQPSCSYPFHSVSPLMLSTMLILTFNMSVTVEKLPLWCFGGAFALMGRCRELSQQLLNEPFNEVKAQMANGTASCSLVADFLNTMKAVALMGYVGNGFFIRTEFIA